MKQYLRKHQNNIFGSILDIGCGKKPYKRIFKNVNSYKGTNSRTYYKNSLHLISEDDVIVEDGTNTPFENETFDSILSFQVLPVFEDPNKFYTEVKRILKPNGYFLLTTDFLYPIWNAPHNYWRTTKFGLQNLAEKNNFEILAIQSFGGYWVMQARLLERYFRSLLPKLISRTKNEKNVVLKLFKVLRLAIWILIIILSPLIINFLFLVFHLLDKIFMDNEFTTNYLVLMQKKQ